jgi:hypothetical protein
MDIIHMLEFPPDAQSDEITLQIVDCSNCHFRGLAVYQESRRGSFDSEAWHHDGYFVSADSAASILQAMDSCPAPGNARCNCAAHISFGRLDEQHYWNGLHGIKIEATFKMKFSS